MRAVVVGYGSIGARHVRVLTALGCEVAVVSRRDVDVPLRFATIAEAVQVFFPEYIVIATTTMEHEQTLRDVRAAGFAGLVLVEKPLFAEERTPEELGISGNGVFVAYNLRFHPVLQRLYSLLREERILTFHAHIGQYLPQWRPDRDYRTVYSADARQGGGALRDLSHELDYVLWICGAWRRLTAMGGHVSHLEIHSDDVYSLLVETERAPVVSIQLNYLDRVAQREIIVNTEKHTFRANLIAGTLAMDGVVETFAVERDDMYREQHRDILERGARTACSFGEGNAVMRMIAAAEQANATQTWVTQ